jgi:hypothetical protein
MDWGEDAGKHFDSPSARKKGAFPLFAMDLITSILPNLSRSCPDGDVGLKYLHSCIDSWHNNGFTIRTINRDEEVNQVRELFGLEAVLFEDRNDPLFAGMFGPPFCDIFSKLDMTKAYCIANSDILMLHSKNLLMELEALSKNAFLFARRTDILDLSLRFDSIYEYGADFVAFRPTNIFHVVNDPEFRKFKLGLFWWDLVLPIAASFYTSVLRIREPFILHLVHNNFWDRNVYNEMQARAAEILRRIAKSRRDNRFAALFVDLTDNLDLAEKCGRDAFSQLCGDWLAGRVGPIEEVELGLDVSQDELVKLIRVNLEESTAKKLKVQKLRKELKKRHKELTKLRSFLEKEPATAAYEMLKAEGPRRSARSQRYILDRLTKKLRRALWLRPRV